MPILMAGRFHRFFTRVAKTMKMNVNLHLPMRFDVSVLIPLEFHRGQAVTCVRGWTEKQDYPADRYQIILCAPQTLNPETEAEIRLLLRPWDLFKRCPLDHDLSLVAKAARMAESELLLFTESHCHPENNALKTLLEIAIEHPAWSGFSCQTIPITHNLLSEIEAEFYGTHIRNEQESTGWMKILDQCFLVHRTDYFEAGGFQPAFGHFSEWLLAAEMHRLGKVIGSDSRKVIHHYYIGEINDLNEFALDFAIGQIKYLNEFRGNSTSNYFPEIPEMQEYSQRSQTDYRSMAKLKTVALPAILLHCFKQKLQQKKPSVALFAVLSDWFASLLKGLAIGSVKVLANWRVYLAKRRLSQALHSQNRDQAKTDFIDLQSKLAYKGRMHYLLNKPSMQNSFIRNADYPVFDTLDFNQVSQKDCTAEWLGFYEREENQQGSGFCWSNPTACVWLPLHEGRYRIIIKWDKVRTLAASELLKVNFDGQAIVNKTPLSSNYLAIDVVSAINNRIRLDWTVLPFPAKGDKRLLGLPITEISWIPEAQLSASSACLHHNT